ncbi:hypothetical protein HYPSUDRAFT_162989 [Hypholoma sublateritium FD-334 SS-4]|uniref:Hydrophobin n=1 Tax=Hypholoma sublateritium (strain FD-334 SS-4) TaxID=945553 RepID=A0A0D2PW25_HYPSF|nr:hypothetical protein HYPSUDRAFT_162989 [Hypholoma sublateritium FD-334 SS-4]
MFYSTLFAVVSAASLVVSVASAPSGTTENSCNTGSLQCCNSMQASNSTTVKNILNLLGLDISLSGVDGDVGVNCSPLLGSGSACTAQPVCCNNDQFNALVVVGCTPISVNI